jgi:hypothetical protein
MLSHIDSTLDVRLHGSCLCSKRTRAKSSAQHESCKSACECAAGGIVKFKSSPRDTQQQFSSTCKSPEYIQLMDTMGKPGQWRFASYPVHTQHCTAPHCYIHTTRKLRGYRAWCTVLLTSAKYSITTTTVRPSKVLHDVCPVRSTNHRNWSVQEGEALTHQQGNGLLRR